MSVLVDFYNLELDLSNVTSFKLVTNLKDGDLDDKGRLIWRTPEADKGKILDFFKKYAPKVLKYKTAKEIQELPKPVYAEQVDGTFGMYEQHYQTSWFDSEDAKLFYWDYRGIHELLDSYIADKKIPRNHLLIFINTFTQGFTPTVFVGDNETKELYSLTMFPNSEIDLSKYTIVRGQSVAGKWNLATAKLASELYNNFVSFLEGELEIRKCAAEDCEKIFIPSTDRKKEVYHDQKCYWRESKRRYRKKIREK